MFPPVNLGGRTMYIYELEPVNVVWGECKQLWFHKHRRHLCSNRKGTLFSVTHVEWFGKRGWMYTTSIQFTQRPNQMFAATIHHFFATTANICSSHWTINTAKTSFASCGCHINPLVYVGGGLLCGRQQKHDGLLFHNYTSESDWGEEQWSSDWIWIWECVPGWLVLNTWKWLKRGKNGKRTL